MNVALNNLSVPSKQSRWITVLLYWVLFAPLIGYASENLWDISGINTLGRGVVIFVLFAILTGSHKFKISKFFWMAFIYYIFTLLIPLIYGFDLRLILNYDLLLCLVFLISANSSIQTTTYDRVIKWMYYLILISLVVSFIQEFYNPLFLVSKKVMDEFEWEQVSNYQYRLQSIWSYVNSSAGGYSVMAFYSVILGNYIEKKKPARSIAILSATVLIYCIMSRQRWILIVFAIISSQMYRIFNKTTNQITVILVILLLIAILYYIGFPLMEVIQYRYLDKEAGGITQGSFLARQHSWRAFTKYIGSAWFLGIRISGKYEEYIDFLGRGSKQNLLGSINPLITYGFFGSIWFYLLLYLLLKRSYTIGKLTKNYGFFVLYVSIIVAGFSNTFTLADPGTMCSFILLKYYEERINTQYQEQEQAQLTKEIQ
jgi:hypothetical protein